MAETYIDQLKKFHEINKSREVLVSDSRWRYFVGGNGDKEVVLVIHGGGGTAESLFRYIIAFEDSYQVIAPTIPSNVFTMEEVMKGIEVILDSESMEKVNIFGVSMGGMIGQCFVRRHPEKVLTLTLFHSMLPSKDYAGKFSKRSFVLSISPRWFITISGRRWVKKQIRREAVNAAPGEKAFWLSYFDKFYRSKTATKEYFVSRSRILVDYFGNYYFNSNDLMNWLGRIYIIESENDQVANKQEREKLKQMYPKAEVHTFEGAGHLGGGLFNVETTVSLVKNFLANSSP